MYEKITACSSENRQRKPSKIRIGTAYRQAEKHDHGDKGRNVVTGLPKTVTLTSEEIREALLDAVSQIVDAVHNVLEKTPPELAADVSERGIVLTGRRRAAGRIGGNNQRENRHQYHDGGKSGHGGSFGNRAVRGKLCRSSNADNTR